MSASSSSPADGKLRGELRIVGLFTSTAYTDSTRTIPFLRRKVGRVLSARRLRSGRPFRQGAGQRAGILSARRIVPDRRRPAAHLRAGNPGAGRAAARARAGPARQVRPLRLGHRLRPARPLRQRRARADRRIPEGDRSRGTSRPTTRPSRKRCRSPACISSSAATAARRRTPIRRRSRPAWRRWCAPGATTSATCFSPARARPIATAARRPLRQGAFPRPIATTFRRRRRSPTSQIFERLVGTALARRRLPLRPSRRSPARSACSSSTAPRRSRCRSACRCWRTWASASSTSAATRSRRRRPAADSPPRDGAGERRRRRRRSRRAVGQALTACLTGGLVRPARRTTATTRLVLGAGLDWRDVALLRSALALSAAQAGTPYSQHYMATTLNRHAAIAAELVRAVPRPLRSRIDATRNASTAARATIEAGLEAVDSLDEDRIIRRFANLIDGDAAHQLLPAWTRTGSRPPRSASSSIRGRSRDCRSRGRSARSSSTRRASTGCTCASARWRAAASAGPTGRRISAPRSSAWSRRSRSRTPSSCRSAPRAASSPKQLPVDGARDAILAEGEAAYRIFIASLLDHHRQSRRRNRDAAAPPSSATTTTIPISSSPPTRARRPFPTSPTASPAARLLAGRRLRQRRLRRLRPQEDGHHGARRLGGGQAPLPRARHRHPDDAVHRRSASATCRATCSATACCCRRRPGWSPPSTIATSSSIPIPTRR